MTHKRKLKLDYDTLKKKCENIILASIFGFSLTVVRSKLTCYDLIAEGYSGIMDITGDAKSPPQKIGAPASDMLAGQDAAMATMAALFDRHGSARVVPLIGLGIHIDDKLCIPRSGPPCVGEHTSEILQGADPSMKKLGRLSGS